MLTRGYLETPVPADGFSDDGSEGNENRSAERHADEATARSEPAETRNRAEYYDALRMAIANSARGDDRAVAKDNPGWDAVGTAERPSLHDIAVPPERASHILDGDASGGGHRHGTGRPGKTEFPAGWDDTKILGIIQDVAQAPDQPPIFQSWNGRWLTRGTRENVEIVAIVAGDGRVWSGWPRPGGPGVVKNPEEA